jgi:hypothetical protein
MCVQMPHGFMLFSLVGIHPCVKRRQIINNNKKFTYRLHAETFSQREDSTEDFLFSRSKSYSELGLASSSYSFFSPTQNKIELNPKDLDSAKFVIRCCSVSWEPV